MSATRPLGRDHTPVVHSDLAVPPLAPDVIATVTARCQAEPDADLLDALGLTEVTP